MVLSALGEVAKILELLPIPVGVASEVSENGQTTDLQLAWANQELRNQKSLPYQVGDRLSVVLPKLTQQGWVEDLVRLKAAEQKASRFIDVKVSGVDQIARLELFWYHGFLIFTVELLSHHRHNRDDAIRAASTVSRIMPKLPIAYSVRGDEDDWIRFPTEGLLENLGFSEKEFKESDFFELLVPEDVEKVRDWSKLPVADRPLPLIFRMGKDQNTYRWVELWAATLPGEEINRSDTKDDVVIVRDIDKAIRLQLANEELRDALQEQLEVMSEALNASHDGFAIWKAIRSSENEVIGFTLIFINKSGAAATGREPHDLIGLTLEDVVGLEESKGLFKLFSASLEEVCSKKDVVQVDSPAGWVGAYENSVVPFSNDQVVTSFHDISEERREHQRLIWLTEHDYLTGMPNRSKLESFLETAVGNAKRDGSMLAFVFIDIDHFKTVNDTFGHDIGDALLVNFVKRIRHSLPDTALAARIAGDEFAVVIEGVRNENHLRELMDEVFNAMKRPFNHNTPNLAITCSAGCVLTDGSERPEEVMRFADKAMYQAKHEGRNRYLIDFRIGE